MLKLNQGYAVVVEVRERKYFWKWVAKTFLGWGGKDLFSHPTPNFYGHLTSPKYVHLHPLKIDNP